MIISAINAMTMTPARAAAIFKGRKHGGHGHDDGREALPWWFFGAGGRHRGVLSALADGAARSTLPSGAARLEGGAAWKAYGPTRRA